MARILTELEIQALLAEPKRIQWDWDAKLKTKIKSNVGYGQGAFSVNGDLGHEFTISVRLAKENLADFSVILSVSEEGHDYNLIRHNGKHKSDHTNVIESRQRDQNCRFRNTFHIHYATQRYQENNLDIDSYALETTLYSDLRGAKRLMVSQYGFVVEYTDSNLPMFDFGPERND